MMGRKRKYNTEEELKEAKRLARKRYRDKNKDKVNEQIEKWKKNNPEKVKEHYENYINNLSDEDREIKNKKNKEWYKNNLEKVKEYYKNNKEKIKKQSKIYRENNKEKLTEASKEWKRNNKEKVKEINIKSVNKRKKEDPLFKLTCNLRSMTAKAFQRNGYSKTSKTQEILGCSFEEFKEHIESQWEPWMNWDNYGKYNGEEGFGWDIDHIKPLVLAESEEDVIKLNYYTNLQPLCSYVNRKIKKDNI